MNYSQFHQRVHFYLEPKNWDAKSNGKLRVFEKDTATSLFLLDTDEDYDGALLPQHRFEFESMSVDGLASKVTSGQLQ